MAHLGARQTEDLEVAGSSPARPILFFNFFFRISAWWVPFGLIQQTTNTNTDV